MTKFIREFDGHKVGHVKIYQRYLHYDYTNGPSKMVCHGWLDLILDDKRMLEVDAAFQKLLAHKPKLSNSEIIYRAILKAAEELD